MTHEPATTKPRPPAARAASRAASPRRRAKLRAARFVSLLCAVLAVALPAAQGALASQDDPDPAQAAAQTPTPAARQPQAAAQTTATAPAQPPTTNAAPQTTAPAPPTTAAPQQAASPSPSPRVVRVYRIGADFKPTPPPTPTPSPASSAAPAPSPARAPTPEFVNREDAMSAGLNDIVVVEVAGLKELLLRSRCLKEVVNAETKAVEKVGVGGTCKPQPILLFIEGRPLMGLPPESGAPELVDGENGTLRYHLQRPVKSDAVEQADVDDTKEHWADLLGLDSEDFIHNFPPDARPVSISVGLASEYPIQTDVEQGGAAGRFNLVRVRGLRLLTWGALFLAFLYLFYRLAREADIIRDRKPIAWERGNRQRKAYSLGRSQIAWWTFFVAFGFIFIWLVTGQYDLSAEVLVLLGISIVTTGGSIAIDKSRAFNTAGETADTSADLAALLNKKDELEQELTRDEGKIPEADFKAKEDAYKTLIANIRRRFPTALGWSNHRFDIDILSDANGVSIHRFQMVLWTVILGFVFVHEVLTRLSMPEFSGTLLLLMGISSGTYLFGKSSEPQAAPTPGAPTDTAALGGGATTTAGGAGATAGAAATTNVTTTNAPATNSAGATTANSADAPAADGGRGGPADEGRGGAAGGDGAPPPDANEGVTSGTDEAPSEVPADEADGGVTSPP